MILFANEHDLELGSCTFENHFFSGKSFPVNKFFSFFLIFCFHGVIYLNTPKKSTVYFYNNVDSPFQIDFI